MLATPSERGELFLDAFKRIERHFRDTLGLAAGVPFKQLVTQMRTRGLITSKQETELASFATLRNALSHWPANDEGAIADPRPAALESIIQLEIAVTKPRRVKDIVTQDVVSLSIDDTVAAFLKIVKELDFSQVPIHNGHKYVGLVTLGALARSVAETMKFDQLDLTRSSIRALLGLVQPEDQFLECSFDITIPEALNMFGIGDERPARGLILVERGVIDKVHALITYEDLPTLMANA